MGLRVDHVLYAVRDLDDAARRFAGELGLESVEGGRHPWGTANRIVPLGDQYVELIAVLDTAAAERSPVGRAVLEAAAHGDRVLAWCVATDDIAATARRLNVEITPGSRTKPDGSTLAWRLAGVSGALQRTAFPFFIHWDVPADRHPGRERVIHHVTPRGFAWVEVGGDAQTLRDWLGGEDVGLRVRSGEPSLCAVGIAIEQGEIVLR